MVLAEIYKNQNKKFKDVSKTLPQLSKFRNQIYNFTWKRKKSCMKGNYYKITNKKERYLVPYQYAGISLHSTVTTKLESTATKENDGKYFLSSCCQQLNGGQDSCTTVSRKVFFIQK